MATYPPVPTAAAVAAMYQCNECQGYFPSSATLSMHLMQHNTLRSLQADSSPLLKTGLFPPPPPPPPLPSTFQPPAAPIAFAAPSPHKNYQPRTATHAAYTSGIVKHFDDQKGFGFLSRLEPGAAASQVFFHVTCCDIQTPLPTRGEHVKFVEKSGPRGQSATSVLRFQSAKTHPTAAPPPPAPLVPAAAPPHAAAHAQRMPERVASAMATAPLIAGVVVSYSPEGGFGTIATFDGASSTGLHFSILSCDIKRPPLTPGERVMVTETTGPKGPTAGVVRRITIVESAEATTHAMNKNKAKKERKKKDAAHLPNKPRIQTGDPSQADAILAALTRAMHMVMASPRNADRAATAPAPQATAATAHQIPAVDSAVPLGVEQYEAMLRNIAEPDNFLIFRPAALALLARTKPVEASGLFDVSDLDSQRFLLQMRLNDELELVRHRDLQERALNGGGDWATELDFGYMAPPSPVAARPPPPTPPVVAPPAPRTMYCGICMDEDPIEDIFLVSGCEHAYCRDGMRNFILGCLDCQEATPECPHDGCDTVLSDVDLTLVLTAEEQDRYYNMCLNLAAGSTPGLFQCLHENCRGVVVLPPEDPHFVCPLCRSERCVQCNTREWHDGLTCEQLRQRQQDNELHPEQLRQIYGDNTRVYQCGGCSFGPIEHGYCSNLATHNGEAVGNARINNGCPRCGWFANDISQWPRWNGQIHPVAQPVV